MWPSAVIPLTGRRGLGIEGTARRGEPRQPEVEHLHAAVRRHDDVGRLQIAVGDAAIVRRGDGFRDLHAVSQQPVRGDAAGADAVREVLPLDELHREGQDAFRFLDRVNRRDVRMAQGRERTRFAPEAIAEGRILRIRLGNDLHRDLPVE